jgi:fatty-acid desaturase
LLTTRQSIFALQVIAYLSVIPMIAYANWYHYLIAFVFYFLYNGIGMIMIYHRLLTHRSFKCPLWWEYLGVVLANFSLTGSAITWIAIHRKHHKFADTDQDPHSPDHLGWWRVQFCTAFAPVEGKYAVDLMRNKVYMWQHKYYMETQIMFALLLALLISPFAVVYVYLFPAALTLFFGTMVLSVAHKDHKPRSVVWLALLTFGDAFHDVHHEDSQKYRLHKYDLIGWLIEKIFVKKVKQLQ